ncbi:MAG: PDZ domain-containing protein [Phycisphaerae bacterium]
MSSGFNSRRPAGAGAVLVSLSVCGLAIIGLGGAPLALADVKPHAGMLRFPDVSATHVAFCYANDIWIVPREGGVATPLASPPGPEMFPRFSSDGQTIAYMGNYDGNRDVYTIPLAGGVPTRITHHPAAETVCDWTPDGRLLFYTNGFGGLARQQQLFTVAAAGGLPEQVGVPYGTNGAITKLPDGRRLLAYTPHTTDFRTWKRYRGGMATDIWVFDLDQKTSRQITNWEGTDTIPMWIGSTVYYLCDSGPEHRLNVWSFDLTSGRREQITEFKEFDVKFPAVGPGPDGGGEIVFQIGAELRLLDPRTRQSRVLDVTIPGDRPTIRPRNVDAAKFLANWRLSPTGKRAVIEARGDVWTVPAQKGSAYNLTRSSGVADRDPAWSPDGNLIAYFSDTSGEYELYVRPADGAGEPRRLTHGSTTYYYSPNWSPDSKLIAFTDKAGNIFLHTLATGATAKIDTEPWSNQPPLAWSHDSGWLAYAKNGDNQQTAIWLYDVREAQLHQVTSGRFNDVAPVFDRKGERLYFISHREFSRPIYEDLGTTFVYTNMAQVLCVPLRADLASPLAPKSDEEEMKSDAATTQPATAPTTATTPVTQSADTATQPGDSATQPTDAVKVVKIDLEGFEARAVELPIKRGQLGALGVNHEGKLLYVRSSRGDDAPPSLKILDLDDDKREEKTVLDGVGGYAISADARKLLVRKDDVWAVIDAAPDQKLEKPMSLATLTVQVAPRDEWKQIFVEAWRIQRDFFYDPHMHGVDWPAMRTRYAAMLDDCVSREDVNYVIAEMISEINVGHAYVLGSGDVEGQPSMSVGMPGCDFELVNGAYRIKTIHRGAPWDSDARGPLGQPGVNVKEGDYLLAVNRAPLDPTRDPWAAFQGLAGRTVSLTIADRPIAWSDVARIPSTTQPATIDGARVREVIVELPGSESDLRYRAYIEGKRAYVDQKSGGKVGYLYVPNTGVDGQNNLFRQFYGQIDKAALIIDERWNGGGQIPTRFIELLNRPVTNYWARRDGKDWTWPPDSHQGPKCMLINGLAGSGGDMFPWLFRFNQLGKLIGMRTWGGLVGISGNPGFIDGGGSSAPTFAFYEKDGTWGVEGHGVDPDIEVIDDPAKMIDGGDPQLDAAIALMLAEIQKNPYAPPQRPAYPDRSGMGLKPEDK